MKWKSIKCRGLVTGFQLSEEFKGLSHFHSTNPPIFPAYVCKESHLAARCYSWRTGRGQGTPLPSPHAHACATYTLRHMIPSIREMGRFKANILRDVDHTEISFNGRGSAPADVCVRACRLGMWRRLFISACIGPEVMHLKINLSRAPSTWMIQHFKSLSSYLTVFIMSISN